MPSATLDSNIYVSALVFRGTPRRLLDLAIDHQVDVAISRPILDETLGVPGEKFGWQPERLDGVKELILGFARKVRPSQVVNVIKEDSADNRILECATEAGSEYIVSGDKDCTASGNSGMLASSRSDMLDVIQGKGWRLPRR